MKTVIITTNIKQKTKDEIKKLGVKYNQLIELGLRAYKDNPQLIARIEELEERQRIIDVRVDRHTTKLFEVADFIKQMKEEKK